MRTAVMLALSASLLAGACAQVLGIEELDVRAPDASVQGDAAAGSAGAATDSSLDQEASPPEGGGESAVDTGDAKGDEPVSEGGEDAPGDAVEEPSCVFGTKWCFGQCVSVEQTVTGCAQPGCDPCQYAHASAICETSGLCALGACANGYEDCDNDPSSGCEASLKTDPLHCGQCATVCSFAHAQADCLSGVCAMGACDTGFSNCDNDPSNGCEVQTALDVANCGVCGTGCSFPHAVAACTAGVCMPGVCDVGYQDCDGQPENGCEVYTVTDPLHCGVCGHACTSDAGAATCKSSQCASSSCAAPTEDCDGNTANGCETNLATSADNCGSCGNVCEVANGDAACVAGACAVGACKSGFGDCDGSAANGCEASLTASVANCGACGNACPTVQNAASACVSGGCTFSCLSGYGDCTAAAGCETDVLSSASHCGDCNAACQLPNATASCASGLCKVEQCSGGWSDCDAESANGCEAPLGGDALNCGACNRLCGVQNVMSRSCASSVCDSTCALGFANCSKPASGPDDGCETSSSDTRCGGCDNDCTKQGGGFVCGVAPLPESLCSCSGAPSCQGQAANSTCTAAGLCRCSNTTCKHGEACVWDSAQSKDACACNGGAACKVGETCCQSPAGCKDLSADPLSCGACGRVCPPGFKCTNNGCACNGDASCNAGSEGTCGGSSCSCGGKQCGAGLRCMPDGTCG